MSQTRRRRNFFLDYDTQDRKYMKCPKRNRNECHDAAVDSNLIEQEQPEMQELRSHEQKGTSMGDQNADGQVLVEEEDLQIGSYSDVGNQYSCNDNVIQEDQYLEEELHIESVPAGANDESVSNEHAELSVNPSISTTSGDDNNDMESSFQEWSEFYKIFIGGRHEKFQVHSDLMCSEILFMVLNYYVRHNLSQSALEDLLSMLNVISGAKIFPATFASFAAKFGSNIYGTYRVYFCVECKYDLGKSKPDHNYSCTICGEKSYDFFVVIPVANQLQEMVIKYSDEIEQYAQKVQENNLADISNGKIARQLISGYERSLTLSVNTDGAAAFNSTTKKPLYPIFVTLNDLPPTIRFSKHNLIVAGLWLSKGEPNTNLLFKYLCLELQNLKEGLTINGENYNVILLQVCLDSVARCKVQRMKQFNGHFGCTMCLHPGQIGNANVRNYPYKKVVSRENEFTRELMEEVHRTGKEHQGVTGKSIFVILPYIDIVKCFPPDYMHAVNLGVVKQIWTLLVESKNHGKPFYIGTKCTEVDRRLLSIRPPSSFARYPRSVQEYKKFKANEWEVILLHYVYPILNGILPQKYLDHIMQLSSTIFALLDPKLSSACIESSEKELTKFIRRFEIVYGKENMTYNVHLLGHLAESALNFGAIYNSSLFPYESGNGMLLNFRSGNNKPIVQIERKYYFNRICHFTTVPRSSDIKQWVSELWSVKKNQYRKQHVPKFTVLNNDIIFDNNVTEKEFSSLGRLNINGYNLCTRDVCKDYKYDDSWIWINNYFYNIVNILCDKHNEFYLVGQKLSTKQKYYNLFVYSFLNEFRVIKMNQSVQQCVNMSAVINGNSVNYISKCKMFTQID